MEEIDISRIITDFKQVFEVENRMIFSAKFGDGKSYFLDKFIKSYSKEDNDYYFITLHPVNYVLEENKDVIEYIKRDILFQLIKDDKIYDYTTKGDKLFNAVCNRESFARLADFLISIVPVDGLKNGIEKTKKLLKIIKEKYEEQDTVKLVDNYLNGFYGLKGSISECDAFTCLIQKTLEHQLAKSVLIIEDLDRLDPAHFFRIMNVLSSQVDNPYYSDCVNENKFGFNKIILVMDYDVAKHIFHHFYGMEANYDGYMSKFLNTIPFRFSILDEAHRQVRAKLAQIFCNQNSRWLCGDLVPVSEDGRVYSLSREVNILSVRRCKEFLDDKISTHISKTWSNSSISIPTMIDIAKLLYCFKFFETDSLYTIFEMLVLNLDGLGIVKLFMPLFCAKHKRNYFTIQVGDIVYECIYDESKQAFSVESTNAWDDDTMVGLESIRNAARSMKEDVLKLIIG